MTTPVPLRRVFFQIMLWSLGAAAAAGFIAMLVASYDVVGRVAATAFATAVASVLMWRLEALLDDEGTFVSGLLGMGSVGVCYLFCLFGIWAEEDVWRWTGVASAAVACVLTLQSIWTAPTIPESRLR